MLKNKIILYNNNNNFDNNNFDNNNFNNNNFDNNIYILLNLKKNNKIKDIKENIKDIEEIEKIKYIKNNEIIKENIIKKNIIKENIIKENILTENIIKENRKNCIIKLLDEYKYPFFFIILLNIIIFTFLKICFLEF